MVRAIRGAITVENNDKNEIFEATKILLKKMIEDNGLIHDDLVSMIFTLTPDLNACFPAAAARQIGYDDVPLMCMCEIPVDGALAKCVRILINTNTDKSLKDIKHVYLREAVSLRRDLVK